MKVLVTGASGWVGQSVCRRLKHDGFDLVQAVRVSSSVRMPPAHFGFEALDAATDWKPALDGIQTVIHLAARVHVMHEVSQSPLADFRVVNVQGTLNLARQAAAAGVRRFIFVSSIKVNGERTRPGQAFMASDDPHPQEPYGISKHEAEVGLRQITAETGMELVIIRPPLVYGAGVKANFAALAHAVQRGWPLPLGAISNQRSLIALDNLVDFIITCATHPQAANQTFLISDGEDLSTTELIRGLAGAAGISARLLPVPVWALELAGKCLGQADALHRLTENLQIDSRKARDLLGWYPKISVKEGLRRVFALDANL